MHIFIFIYPSLYITLEIEQNGIYNFQQINVTGQDIYEVKERKNKMELHEITDI